MLRSLLRPVSHLRFTQLRSVRSLRTNVVRLESKTSSSGAGGSGGAASGDILPDRAVSNWLLIISGMIFGMVSLGGVTRLTKSGLSMVDWKFTGEKLPQTKEDWDAEFNKYKAFPEYQKENQHMELDEFKFIFMMEYIHRMWGRAIGVAFGLPFLYFLARGRLPGAVGRQAALLLGLGATQGMIGWWMVKSGLSEPQPDEQRRVSVSPYRLAVHLISAFVIYGLTVDLALKTRTGVLANSKPTNLKFSRLSLATTALVGLTAFSGAFVAGNEAGLVYNEFPLMGGKWVPDDLVNPHLRPSWRNLFENSTMVQFDHRILGTSTLAAVWGLHLLSRKMSSIPRAAIRVTGLASGMVLLQVTLGITTLLTLVPVPLAAAHQAGSLTLLTLMIWGLHTLRQAPSPATKIVSVGGLLLLEPLQSYLETQEQTAEAETCANEGMEVSLTEVA